MGRIAAFTMLNLFCSMIVDMRVLKMDAD